MKKYVCSSCQLKYLDPLQIPIKTLLHPFRVCRVEDFDNKEDPKTPLKLGSHEVSSYFDIENQLLLDLKSARN